MGGAFGRDDMSVLGNGGLIVMQSPQVCLLAKPAPPDADAQKFDCLAMLSDAQWQDFIGKLEKIVNRFWSETWQLIGFPVLLLAVVLAVLTIVDELFSFAMVPVFFLAAVSSLGARAFIVAQNSSLDAQIEAWCRELTMSTGGMVNVQYRTRYTGFCNLKIARSRKALYDHCCAREQHESVRAVAGVPAAPTTVEAQVA
ncbi:unnamed protein product [Effrenium voratum]|nr:unnamed protein product [Effrenium voratum]